MLSGKSKLIDALGNFYAPHLTLCTHNRQSGLSLAVNMYVCSCRWHIVKNCTFQIENSNVRRLGESVDGCERELSLKKRERPMLENCRRSSFLRVGKLLAVTSQCQCIDERLS